MLCVVWQRLLQQLVPKVSLIIIIYGRCNFMLIKRIIVMVLCLITLFAVGLLGGLIPIPYKCTSYYSDDVVPCYLLISPYAWQLDSSIEWRKVTW